MSNIEFLSRSDYTEAICKLVNQNSELNIAVSYWGKSSLSKLGISKRLKEEHNNLKVICDFGHIACRIDPIQELHKKNAECVKLIKGLHAKVWVSQSEVIIGSANSSASALPDQDQTKNFNEEAGILIRDKSIVERIQQWFDELWCKKSRYITLADFDKKQEDHSDEKRKGIYAKTRSDLPEEQSQSEDSQSTTELKPLEYFVGNDAALAVQTSLTRLNFKRNVKNRFTFKYNDIPDMESFSKNLLEILQTLIEDAHNVNRDYTQNRRANFDSILEVLDVNRKILNSHVVDFVKQYEGRYVWIDKRKADPNAGFTLRLHNELPKMQSISILTVKRDRVEVTGDRPFIVIRI